MEILTGLSSATRTTCVINNQRIYIKPYVFKAEALFFCFVGGILPQIIASAKILKANICPHNFLKQILYRRKDSIAQIQLNAK